jgi:hypothetical protein
VRGVLRALKPQQSLRRCRLVQVRYRIKYLEQVSRHVLVLSIDTDRSGSTGVQHVHGCNTASSESANSGDGSKPKGSVAP